jgi:hypothetical protein
MIADRYWWTRKAVGNRPRSASAAAVQADPDLAAMSRARAAPVARPAAAAVFVAAGAAGAAVAAIAVHAAVTAAVPVAVAVSVAAVLVPSIGERLPVHHLEPVGEVELDHDGAELAGADVLGEVKGEVHGRIVDVLEVALVGLDHRSTADADRQALIVEAGRRLLVAPGSLDAVDHLRVDAGRRAGERDARRVRPRIVEDARRVLQIARLDGVADELQVVELHRHLGDLEPREDDVAAAGPDRLAVGAEIAELDHHAAVWRTVGGAAVTPRPARVGRMGGAAAPVVAAGRASDEHGRRHGAQRGCGAPGHWAPPAAISGPPVAGSPPAFGKGFFRDLGVTGVQASNNARPRVDTQRPLGGDFSPKRSIL